MLRHDQGDSTDTDDEGDDDDDAIEETKTKRNPKIKYV
jgi:hypothetical protein